MEYSSLVRRQTLSMTREIQRSFRELLDKTDWIDDETKRLATEKVNAMSLRIGYPDFILQSHLLNERYKDVRCARYIVSRKVNWNYSTSYVDIYDNASTRTRRSSFGQTCTSKTL